VSQAASDPRPAAKVSVMLITYNHEKFVGQALESILTQETNFPFEVHVVEDCSTDNTQTVIRSFKEKYPDKIHLHFNEKNVGSAGPYLHTQKVFYEGFKHLKGEYFAILEGDDYWTHPKKLQKFVDFLDNHPTFVACAHNTVKVYEDGSQPPHRFLYWEGMYESYQCDGMLGVFVREDFFAMRAFFHTSSILYRNVFKGVPPVHFRNRHSCDIFITMAHMEHGKLRYFDEDMSVYRAHAGGCYSHLGEAAGQLFTINCLIHYNRWFRYRYLRIFSLSIHCLSRDLLKENKKTGQLNWKQRLQCFYLKYIYGGIYLTAQYSRLLFRFCLRSPQIIFKLATQPGTYGRQIQPRLTKNLKTLKKQLSVNRRAYESDWERR
jgi:glycosyltransferase involved in cell wall biosynthesis